MRFTPALGTGRKNDYLRFGSRRFPTNLSCGATIVSEVRPEDSDVVK